MAKKKETPISIEKYIKENGRKLQLEEAYVVDDEFFKNIFILRVRKNLTIVIGIYTINVDCCGLIETSYLESESKEDFLNFITKVYGDLEKLEQIDPILAQNIVYESVDWAENAGFKLPKEFRISEYLLEDPDILEFKEVSLGQNGKYYLYCDPDSKDDMKIANTLIKNLEPDKYFIEYSNEVFNDENDIDEEDDFDENEIDDLLFEENFYDRYIDDISFLPAEVEDINYHEVVNKEEGWDEEFFTVFTLIYHMAIHISVYFDEKEIDCSGDNLYDVKEIIADIEKVAIKEFNNAKLSNKLKKIALEFLNIETLVFNEFVFESYTYVFLPEFISALKANMYISNGNDVDYTESKNYYEFLANLKNKTGYHIHVLNLIVSDVEINENNLETTLGKTVDKVFKALTNVASKEYINLSKYNSFKEIELLKKFYDYLDEDFALNAALNFND